VSSLVGRRSVRGHRLQLDSSDFSPQSEGAYGQGESLRSVALGLWPNLSEVTLAKFFALCQMLVMVCLVPDLKDALRWAWSWDGMYSSKSDYGAFFAGRPRATTASQIWHSRAPYGCKFFAWIVSRDRCWTANRLERQGWSRPTACSLCDQEPETIQHLLLGCVVSREVWAWALHQWDRISWLPTADTELLQWWTSRSCPAATQQDLWTAIILIFRCI
jgi:hypothetical protein